MCLMKFLTGVVLVLFAFSNSCAQTSQSNQDPCPTTTPSPTDLYVRLGAVKNEISELLKSPHIPVPTLPTDDNTAQSYRAELSNFTSLFVKPCNPNRQEWVELEEIQNWMKASIAALQQIERDIVREMELTEFTTEADFEMERLLEEIQCYLRQANVWDENTYNQHRDDSTYHIRDPLARHRTLEQMHYRNRYIIDVVQEHLQHVAENIMLCNCSNHCDRKRASWLRRQLRKREQEFLLDNYEPGLDRPAKRAWEPAGFEDMGVIEEEYGYDEPEIKRAWETLLGPAVVESDKRDWDRYEETPAARYTAEDVKRAWEFLYGQREKPRKRLSQSWMTNL